MGFSNEYLTEEEKKLIAKTGHIGLNKKTKNGIECLREYCTVDRERKIWMLHYRYDSLYNPNDKEDNFVIFYGSINNESRIEVCLKNLGIEKDISVKKKYGAHMIKYWKIKDMKCIGNMKLDNDEMLFLLEEIMTAYQILGEPKDDDFNEVFKAIVYDNGEK